MISNLFTYMARFEVNETRVTLAVSNSQSLRTTIPIHIAKKMGLNAGDNITWDLDKISNNWIATIRKK